ncbi:phosphatase PAP2-related protein [Patescibacteria group bacterium]
MKEFFKKSAHHWKLLLKDKTFLISFISSIVLSLLSYAITIAVSLHIDSQYYAPVGDLILNRIPTYNLDILFTWGIWVIVVSSIFYTVLWRPEITPFALKSFALMYFVRCGFIILTDVGPPEGFYYENIIESTDSVFQMLIFKNDLFFSGHVAIPFLSFLVFRKSIFSWFMLLASFIMAITVLLMHIHYSIDVFAAFFITYSIYALSDKIFNNMNIRYKEIINKYGWESMKNKIKYRKKRNKEKRYKDFKSPTPAS